MLNLNYQILYQYSKSEKLQLKHLKQKYGRKYQKVYGVSKKRVWYDGEVKTACLKHKIIKKLLFGTRFRCSYCGKRLINIEKSIDHFILNSSYPEYSFHPLNLILSCGYCNSSLKSTTDVVNTMHKKYKNMKFTIVHPIIDEVNTHFFFKDTDNTVFDLARCSKEAKETIRIFKWETNEMLLDRIAQATIKVHLPLSNLQLIEIIDECTTYKPKK